MWRRIPHDGIMNGETTVAVTCPRAWNDELAYGYTCIQGRVLTILSLSVCMCFLYMHFHMDSVAVDAQISELT